MLILYNDILLNVFISYRNFLMWSLSSFIYTTVSCINKNNLTSYSYSLYLLLSYLNSNFKHYIEHKRKEWTSLPGSWWWRKWFGFFSICYYKGYGFVYIAITMLKYVPISWIGVDFLKRFSASNEHMYVVDYHYGILYVEPFLHLLDEVDLIRLNNVFTCSFWRRFASLFISGIFL